MPGRPLPLFVFVRFSMTTPPPPRPLLNEPTFWMTPKSITHCEFYLTKQIRLAFVSNSYTDKNKIILSLHSNCLEVLKTLEVSSSKTTWGKTFEQ